MKLEEAHIPAPSRAKLVFKSGTASERNELGVSEAADENAHRNEYATATKTSLPVEDGFTDREVKQSYWLSNRLVAKKCHKIDNTTKNIDVHDSNSTIKTNDLITFDRKHGTTYVRVESDEEEDNVLASSFQPDVTLSKRTASRVAIIPKNRRNRPVPARNAQSNLLELRNEVSVPEDKADTERQDLSCGRRLTSSSSSSSTSDSDTPEQAMNDTIEHSRRLLSENDYEERLGINAVSPESMQVLAQFESAMLETDCSNAATC